MNTTPVRHAVYHVNLAVPCGKMVGFALPERGSTGYIWDVDAPDTFAPVEKQLTIKDHVFIPISPTLIGAGGVHVFLAQAPEQAGVYLRQLTCWRPWDQEVVAEAYVSLQATEGSPDYHVTPAAPPDQPSTAQARRVLP
jgi:predicted secreted protein